MIEVVGAPYEGVAHRVLVVVARLVRVRVRVRVRVKVRDGVRVRIRIRVRVRVRVRGRVRVRVSCVPAGGRQLPSCLSPAPAHPGRRL